MNVTEKGDMFYCDCGFSWRRGHSGAHDCGKGLRSQRDELLAALELLTSPATPEEQTANHFAALEAIARAKGGAA